MLETCANREHAIVHRIWLQRSMARSFSRRSSVAFAMLLDLTLLFLCFGTHPSYASDFYARRTLTLIVGSDAGGGYDTYSRLLGRYISKYIPGAPAIVVQNIPGGGGIRAAQTLYAQSPKDGATIANLRASTLLDSILGISASEIDPAKYNWVGNMASDTDLCSFWGASGIRTIDDLRRRPTLVGVSGKGAQAYSFTNAINHFLGTKMKMILGYQGMGDRLIALQGGELQGNCGINSSSIVSIHGDLLSSGKLVPIMQSGLTPYPALKDVPLTQSFAKNEKDRRTLTTLFSQMSIARVFAAPPGVPNDRVAILRTAFMEAMNDPGLKTEAEHMKLDLMATSGRDVASIVETMADIPTDEKKLLKAAADD
jgi:tripartite-type tricarboxylate transporter receptor subunit TctC